jgi:hypothetical protein
MAVTASGISSVASDIGGAVGAFFGADGSEDAAHSYFKAGVSYLNAKDLALQNKQISEESTAIKEFQTERKVNMGIGAQEAQLAGNGVTGGSAGDLLRMSMQQGGLARAVVGQQGAIDSNAFQQQADAYQASSDSAVASGNAALHAAAAQNAGGIMGIIGAGIKLGAMFI